MATPTDNVPVVGALHESDRRAAITKDVCVFCLGLAKDFRNEVSKREFSISGMCQECQNETFGTDR
jgi:hypothetical protein